MNTKFNFLLLNLNLLSISIYAILGYMINKSQQFRVIIEQDEEGFFVASVPALPGCYTQAKTMFELKKRIKEAISLCLDMSQIDSQYRKRMKVFAYNPSFVGLETVAV